MKTVGQVYRRDELERGDVFSCEGGDLRYVVVSNDGMQRNKSYSGAPGQYKCVRAGSYFWATPEYHIIFLGVVNLDDQDRYDPKELEAPRASSDGPPIDFIAEINKTRIDNCLCDFDFKKVEALNRILSKSTILNEDQLKNLARQMLKEFIEDDKKVWEHQSPSNLLVTRRDDRLNLWYAPIYGSTIEIELNPPKCDGIRHLDLDD